MSNLPERPGRRPHSTGGGDRSRPAREVVGSAEVEAGAAERLTFFSDAVAAIALTLLAIDLPVPDGLSAHDLWSAVRADWTDYLAFVISFVTIAAHWSGHHRVFRFVGRADDRLRLLSMVWLFAIVLIPFVTRVVAHDESWDPGGSGPVRFAAYSTVQLVANGAMVLMLLHIRRAGLYREDTPAGVVGRSYWHSATMATGFLVSIPVFFFWSRAWIIWIVTPIVLGTIGRRYITVQLRKRGEAPADGPADDIEAI